MNSLVPSSGSTRKNGSPPMSGTLPAANDSSATTAMPGAHSPSPSRMTRSARVSASVTGEASAFPLTEKSPA